MKAALQTQESTYEYHDSDDENAVADEELKQ